MTKQQIVAQLAAAKITQNGYIPGDCDLEDYGKLAEKIIEMFPEPSTEIVYNSVEIGPKKFYKPSSKVE